MGIACLQRFDPQQPDNHDGDSLLRCNQQWHDNHDADSIQRSDWWWHDNHDEDGIQRFNQQWCDKGGGETIMFKELTGGGVTTSTGNGETMVMGIAFKAWRFNQWWQGSHDGNGIWWFNIWLAMIGIWQFTCKWWCGMWCHTTAHPQTIHRYLLDLCLLGAGSSCRATNV